MFSASKNLEIKELKEEVKFLNKLIVDLKEKNKDLYDRKISSEEKLKDVKWDLEHLERKNELTTQEKLNKLKSDMKTALVESDLARIEATSKLEIYEKLDTKADANIIKETVASLITALGKNNKQDISVIK